MSHYDVLGLSASATAAEIRQRYHELAKVVHPDAGGDRYQFQILADAFAVLDDPVARARYDAMTLTEPRAAEPGRQQPKGRLRPTSSRSEPDGITGWLVDGCGMQLAEWLFAIPFFIAVWILATITGWGFGELQTAAIVALVVFVAIVLVRRAWRARAGS